MAIDKTNKLSIVRGNTNEAEYIHSKLIEHNKKHITDYDKFTFSIKDDCNNILGGIIASRTNQRMTIDYLWIDDSVRGGGWGRKLVEQVEEIAKEKDCTLIWLNTFDFQAPDFYVKMGYELFGTLENCINGHNQYFFKKKLCR